MTDDDSITDDSPDLDPADFDIDAWIGGVTTTVRAVTLYQRSDLIAVVEDLQRRLRVARAVPVEDQGITDDEPAALTAELERAGREFEHSARVFKVEGRTDETRERLSKRLKKQGVTDEVDVLCHMLADAIIDPKGVTPAALRRLGEKSEPQLRMLLVAAQLANTQPPRVDVPFSSESSSGRRRQPSS